MSNIKQTCFYADEETIKEIRQKAKLNKLSFSNYLILLHKANIKTKNKGVLLNG